MSQAELKKAASLILQGEAGQARMIIQSVLRQDAHNLDAWWMLTQVARDSDEKRRAVTRVLTIKPNHAQAKQMIAELDSEAQIDTQGAERPSIGDLLSQPKSADIFDDEDDDIFNFETSVQRQAPTKTPTTPSKRGRMVVFVASAVILLGVAGFLVAALGESQESEERRDDTTILSETVHVVDNDVAEIEISTRGLVSITVEGMGDFDPVLTVYNHDGSEIAYNDDHSGVQGLDSLDAAVEAIPINGFARIEISDYWDADGRALVTVMRVGDLPAISETIDVGESKTVFVDHSLWLEMNLSDTEEITVIAQGHDSDFDPVLEIYDADYRLIASNDNHQSDYSYLDALDSVIEDLSLSGTVYIHIHYNIGDGRSDVTISVK